MHYTNITHKMGLIAVGLAFFAGQSSFADQSKKEQEPVKQAETTSQSANLASLPILPELTMASHFSGVPYAQSGVSVSVVNVKKLQTEGIETLSGALASVPGVYTQDGGSTFQRGSVSKTIIRGMNQAAYTLTMVDGMRISDPNTTGDKYFGITDLFSLGGLEIVKGSQGAVYGSGAVGGVVAMETPTGDGKPTTKIFAEAGSFDSVTSYVTSQGRLDKLTYFVGVGYEYTANDPSIYVGESTEYKNPTTKNNDFEQWSEALRLTYDVNDKVTVSLTYRRNDATLQYPTLDWNAWPADTIYVNEDKNHIDLITAKIDAKLTDKWTSSLMVGYYGQLYTCHQPDLNPEPSYYKTTTDKVQMEWRNLMTWNKKWKTTWGMAWDRTDYKAVSPNYEAPQNQLDNVYAFFGEQMWSPSDYFDASLALRLEHSTVWNNHFTWRYSNVWNVQGKDAATRIIGSIGSGFRAPTFLEQKGSYKSWGSLYQGNPDLNVAKSLGGDLGIEQRLATDHYFTLTGFWTRVNDEISSAKKTGYRTWENMSHSTSYGIETSFFGKLSDYWNTGYELSYTYTMPKGSEMKNGTIQLNDTARHMIKGTVYCSPIESVTTGFRVLSAMNRTCWNGQIDNFCTVGWFAKWQATEKLAFHLRVENLTNEKYLITNDYDFGPREARGTGVYGGVSFEF